METTLADMVRHHARTRGQAVALDTADGPYTFADLDARSSQVAQALVAAGVSPGDRVAILDKNGVEYFDLLFACSKVGAVDVALNFRLTPAELAYVLEHSQARVLVVGPDFSPLLSSLALDGVQVVRVGEEYDAWRSAQPATDPQAEAADDDVVMQLYTSGTTGRPKGAMLTNRNIASLITRTAPILSLDESSQHLVVMPLFHIGGSGLALMGVQAGCRTVLKRDFVPADVIATLRSERITNALFVPAMLNVLTTVPGAGDEPYPDLRSIVYGASPITEDVLQRSMTTFGCDFVQVYGLSETSGLVSYLSAEDHRPSERRATLLRSAGRPYPWVEIRIVDTVTGQDRAPGEVGEVWTRSDSVMKGYWQQPDASAEVLVEDGWFRTGDAGFVDEQGYLFLTDRIKDMIITGGENVYPVEVENVLSTHPAVVDVAVIGVPDEKWGETVKAVVVPAEGAQVDPAELIAHARASLAGFKCPTSVDVVDALPRNPTGKVLKRELRAPYWEGHERSIT